MKILDLFSGAGGFSLGFLKAGFKIDKHYFSEIDKHAIACYKYNFKNSEYVGSVTDFREWSIERPNIITFGSPCQDFSLAGKRKGIAGERSSLLISAIECVRHFKPDVFIWENVKGTFSSNAGQDFIAILKAFADLRDYVIEWQLVNSSWVICQNRERIYLVGHLRGRSKPGVFPFGESDFKNNTIQRQPRTNTLLQKYGNDAQGSYIIERKLNAQEIKVKSNTSQGYEIAQEGDSINLSNPNSETRRGRVGKGKAQTLETSCNQAVCIPVLTPDRVKKRQNGRRFKNNGDESFTLTAQDKHGVMIETGIRRLTEIECERLQTFPDNHSKYGIYDGEVKEISRTQRYKLMGNAVTVDIVKIIAERICLS